MSRATIIARSYWCPTCQAGPGEPCSTSTGQSKADQHAERVRDVDRCDVCGTWLAADHGAPLCDRHQLLHDLETERATLHKRAR